jgi:RNA polymerase sigma-70 factor (ECF subfamily)
MNSDFGEKTIPHVDLLFTYALLITGENRQAEKILSKTFAKAFWFWQYLSKETDIKFWLIRIMMNIFRNNPDYAESGNVQISQNKSIDLSKIKLQDYNKEFDYQKIKLLGQLISSLPLLLKEVIIFTDVLKFNYELVEDLTETPEVTIRKRLFDARKEILFGWLQNKSKELSLQAEELSLKDKLFVINRVDNKELEESQSEKVSLLKSETESQGFVKNIIVKNISLQPIRERIKIKLVNKYASQLRDEIEKTPSPERRSIVRVATFAMVILITMLILIFRPTQENPAEYAAQQVGEDNILVQLKNNYSLYVDGKLNKDLITGDEVTIKDSLATSGLKYKSIIPKFTGWNIESALLTIYNDQKLINLIYKNKLGKKLYLYQVPLQLVEIRKIVKLAPVLMEYLEANNCYSSRDGKTIYLLKYTESHILGFALDDPQKEEVIEICGKSYNRMY